MSPNRAVIFIDGNNWYHGLKEAGVKNLRGLDYVKIAKKLVGPRDWVQTRYYIGQVPQAVNAQLYADQRSFLANFKNADTRHDFYLGRLETRSVQSESAIELLQYLSNLTTRIDTTVYQALVAIGNKHRRSQMMVEKAVDVMLAVDLVVMAERDEFDTAYILSADGDYTHAVAAVRSHDKKVFAASTQYGTQLAGSVNSFIKIESSWLDDCYS
jgi:uncharacterized LabA/DUF88 family protein